MPRPVTTARRRALWWEIAIVLGLSLGPSSIYSIISLIRDLTSKVPLSQHSTALNPSLSPVPWLDATYQILGNVLFPLFAVALALYLLWTRQRSGFARIGLDLTRPGRDVLGGVALLAVIGIPGLGLYALGRFMGLTVAVQASSLSPWYWWTIPVLVLSALRAALQEEVIVVGYLFTRLGELGWRPWATILAAAVFRGSYHLYQGIGPFFGNVAMGIVFGWCYTRWGRTAPLVVAHWLLDTISFVGYPLALAWWPALFGVR